MNTVAAAPPFLAGVRWRIAALGGGARALLALLAGGFGAVGFAPVNAPVFLLLALVVLFWLVDTAASGGLAFRLGSWFGFGQMLVGLYWIAIAFQFQSKMPVWAGLLAVVLLAAYLAFYCGFACGLARRFWPAGPGRVAVFAVAWGVGEWMRGHFFTGFPWNLAGLVWIDVAPVAQLAAWFGGYGLSVLTVLLAGAFALVAEPGLAARRWTGGILVLMALAVAGGWLAARSPPAAPRPPVPLLVVQADIGQSEKYADLGDRALLHKYLDLTRAAQARHGPALVIWPETAIDNLIADEVSTRYLMARAIRSPGLLLTGGLRIDRGDDDTPISARNAFFVLDAEGHVRGVYDKAHLVPFGEYVPWRPLMEAIGVDRLAPGGIDFAPGPGPRTLDLPGVPAVGPLICYEIIFPGAVVEEGRRPAWLLNLSNDAWFGLSSGPYQHLAQARLRAIEEGLPVVRATSTGVSAVIDARGHVVGQLGLGARGVLHGVLPAALPPTAYARWGDWMAVLLCAALGLAAAWGGRAREYL